ncbi:hypothetical protein MUP79_06780 [Candidatus Bathyarchaeota archaeon]|nr:hypothetical protein [Candidatus Bathyarchaeota archaeon]
MDRSRNVTIAPCVLELSLVAVGIYLSIITQTETRYRDFLGYQVPYQEKIQPYVGVGVLIIIVGTVVIIGTFMKNRAH